MTSCLDKVWLTGWGGTCPNMFEGGTSPLFIVRLRTFKPDNGWVIAIFSKVLPNESSRPRRSVAKWRHPAHASITHRCLQEKVLPNDVRVQRSLWARTPHSLTTLVRFFASIILSYFFLSWVIRQLMVHKFFIRVFSLIKFVSLKLLHNLQVERDKKFFV